MLTELDNLIADTIEQEFKHKLDVRTGLVSHADGSHGDFTANVAFRLSKELKTAPADVAVKLAAALRHPSLESAVAAGGYVNLTMKDEFWSTELAQVSQKYGHTQRGRGQKVQVEFISANPTGPTTIGNARGGFIGDVLSRVLESQGYDVTREYYFNNAGTQIGKLLESVKVSAGLVEADDVQYRGEYINELAQEFKQELATKTDDELRQILTTTILERYIRPAIAMMGITYDEWFNEDDLVKGGALQKTVQKLKDLGLVYQKDGAVWLDTAKLGVEREARVLIKSNGDPTYLAPDIAYHDDLFENRGFDWSIKVLGADHIDQFPSVQAAVKALHPDKKLTMAGHQWFRLIKDGKEVKISKRLGQFVTISELITEVTLPVARFFTLMRSSDSHMDFDMDLAKKESQDNPYWYVMYSYARGGSILRQAAEKGLKPGKEINVLTKQERAIIKQISQFPYLLERICEDYGVHRLTFFGMELAKLFHDYYESERIIDMEPQKATNKLYFIQRYLQFMDDYFAVLGISPIEKM